LLVFEEDGKVTKARSTPSFLAPVRLALLEDFQKVFGRPTREHFLLGNFKDTSFPFLLNLKSFCERSNGIFGKSGTGKSFITRIILAGILAGELASVLVFDMHNEYGWSAYSEAEGKIFGLKELFPNKVKIFALDEQSALRHNVQPDRIVKIGLNQITPEDLLLLSETLNLTPSASDTAYILEKQSGDNWLKELLSWDPYTTSERARSLAILENSLFALQRKLRQLEKLPYIKEVQDDSVVEEILGHLKRKESVVLDFGRFQSELSYLLVSNILSRRIYESYRQESELAQDHGGRVWPLIMVIEEAHNFLKPEIASQTIFGRVAREMRKFGVTLLVVDQRPSQIDREVLSQLGTKICYPLSEEKDIEAVFVGTEKAGVLKSMLSTLASKEQALIFGYALPVPLILDVRKYDKHFSEEIKGNPLKDQAKIPASAKKSQDLLFPE
jgi:DNA helicase HerA-like ATPase